mgnify:CR=1 FL=1
MFPWWEVLLRLGLATLLGGLIGWERETRRKPAGLRTLMLVSLSSCIYVVAAIVTARQHEEPIDAVRAVSGVAQGVGFIGAGVILQSRGEVRWLTTAASLWGAAGLGAAVGLGQYLIALAGGVLVYGTLRWAVLIESRMSCANHDKSDSDNEEHEKKS